ncbi:hypothetical protein CBS11350_2008 [Aspergillus niger]|nr:hypothetical protein CBS11350_2008 [Aspergillus niger]
MAETYAELEELHKISQRLYPSLPPDEAYLALNKRMLSRALDVALPVGEVTATRVSSPGGQALVLGARHLREGARHLSEHINGTTSSAASKPITSTPAAEASTVPAQENTRVIDVRKLVSTTTSPSKSVSQGVETATADSSLVDGIDYLECWNTALRSMQVAQAHQAIKALNVIAGHLDDRNCIAVSGAGGPDGFARPVYDLINKKINEVAPTERDDHRFFVYHDATNWHPAFARLTSENPLPPEFINQPGDDLDHMCLFMREVRQTLIRHNPSSGKAIVFHLIIPSWTKLCIKEPVHFPEDIYPLRIEGVKYKGKEQVELNLPLAPPGLLHGVANVVDPNGWNKIAAGASIGITLPTVGWGVNSVCLGLGLAVGSLTGLGLFATVPIWWGTGGWAMTETGRLLEPAIYDLLREESPRVLGSNQRVDLSRFYS